MRGRIKDHDRGGTLVGPERYMMWRGGSTATTA
jgi:hypothetical protein